MKLTHLTSGARRQSGIAVIVVLALLALILLYIGANARSLDHLRRELKLVETRQTRRLAAAGPRTNQAPLTLGLQLPGESQPPKP